MQIEIFERKNRNWNYKSSGRVIYFLDTEVCEMASKNTMDIDPMVIMFTHSRIRPFFTGCGRRIEDTLLDITEGRTVVEDLPLITVIENDGYYYSLNNRRLYVLKRLRVDGLLVNNVVKVHIKTALEREKKKYTPENCVLEAKIMKEHDGNEEEQKQCEGSESQSHQPITSFNQTTTTTKVSSKSVPLSLRTCKIDPLILRALPDLKKQLGGKGNKRKQVLSQLDEWCMSGMLSEDQRIFVDSELGI